MLSRTVALLGPKKKTAAAAKKVAPPKKTPAAKKPAKPKKETTKKKVAAPAALETAAAAAPVTPATPEPEVPPKQKPTAAPAVLIPARVYAPYQRHTNGLSLLNFECHHRDAITKAMQALPYKSALRADPKYGHTWVEMDVATNLFETKLKSEFADVEPLVLKTEVDLPMFVGIDGESTMEAIPRKLYHASLFEKPCIADDFIWETKRFRNPRCGETGVYFSNEELVAGLNKVYMAEGVKSNLWIAPSTLATNPRLSIRPSLQPFTVMQTARVFVTGASQGEVSAPKNLLKTAPNVEWRAGMNLLNNHFVASEHESRSKDHANPGLCELTAMGINGDEPSRNRFWVSQQQMEFYSPNVETNDDKALRYMGHKNEKGEEELPAGRTAEVKEWVRYNQDQLEVPGRLALKKSGWERDFFAYGRL